MKPIKDWKDLKNYDFSLVYSLDGWCWEFLRRNHEYRTTWEEELSTAETKSIIRDKKSRKIVELKQKVIEPGLREKWGWGITPLKNPEMDYIEEKNLAMRINVWCEHPGVVNRIPAEYVEHGYFLPSEGRSLNYKLFPDLPHQPQLDHIRSFLQSQRSERIQNSPKPKTDLWPLYLRIWDATEANLTVQQIVIKFEDEIYKDNNNLFYRKYGDYSLIKDIYRYRKKAERLINGFEYTKYLVLL